MQAPVAPEFYVEEERPHLGGYIVGGDPATYYPNLWDWLVQEHCVSSVIDVGCGEGHALDYFARAGCYVRGVDGIPQRANWPGFVCHDYTTGPYEPSPWGASHRFDLAWSCEFVEHVEEQYLPNFLATFRCADMVAMTHAEPGQPGHHHVNCRTADYWKGVMAAVGFAFDEETTLHARLMAAMNQNPINHFSRSGLVFRAA